MLVPIAIVRAPRGAATDGGIVSTLAEVYIGGGFTPPSTAAQALKPENVHARGDVYVALDGERVIGMVVLVPPGAPCVQVALIGECELHLLAVLPEYRGHGVGSALIRTVLQRVEERAWSTVLLSTQPSQIAAHRLYEREGFERLAARDWLGPDGRRFLVYRRLLTRSRE